MVKTYLQQLEEVQAAITAIETNAQSVTVKGRTYTYGDLQVLYNRESELRIKAERESGGGGIKIRGVTPL